jgi:MFS family permease
VALGICVSRVAFKKNDHRSTSPSVVTYKLIKLLSISLDMFVSRITLVVILLAVAFSGYPSYALAVFRQSLQDYFALNLQQLGLFYSIGFIPAAFGALLTGLACDRKGVSYSSLRLSILGVAFGFALVAISEGISLVYLALIWLSYWVAALGIQTQCFLVQRYPEARRRLLSLALLLSSIGGVAYPLLAEYLLNLTNRPNTTLTFEQVFKGPFFLIAVLLSLSLLLVPRSKKTNFPEVATQSVSFLQIFQPLYSIDKASLVLALMLVLHSTADSISYIWMPRVLASASFEHQRIAPGVVMSLYSCAYVVTRTVLSFLAENKWRQALIFIPGLLGGTTFIVGLLLRTDLSTAIGYLLGAFFWSIEYPVLLALLAERQTRLFGSVQAALGLLAGISIFVFTNLMGVIGSNLLEHQLWLIVLIPATMVFLVGVFGILYLKIQYKTSR